MTQLLQIGPGAHVLEVGTGSGYQTAVLAELAAQVSTIEIVEPLAADARAGPGRPRLRQHRVPLGDGAAGWPEQAPFDGIIVTAAAREIPRRAGRSAAARRSPGDPGRPRPAGPGAPAGREGRRRAGPRAAAVLGRVRAADAAHAPSAPERPEAAPLDGGPQGRYILAMTMIQLCRRQARISRPGLDSRSGPARASCPAHMDCRHVNDLPGGVRPTTG